VKCFVLVLGVFGCPSYFLWGGLFFCVVFLFFFVFCVFCFCLFWRDLGWKCLAGQFAPGVDWFFERVFSGTNQSNRPLSPDVLRKVCVSVKSKIPAAGSITK